MGLHRLTEIAIGVPNVEETAAYYAEFGLTPTGTGFRTADGGEQLRIRHSPHRRLLSLGIGVDDPDDLGRITASLAGLGVDSRRDGDTLRAADPVTGLDVTVSVAPRLVQTPTPAPA